MAQSIEVIKNKEARGCIMRALALSQFKPISIHSLQMALVDKCTDIMPQLRYLESKRARIITNSSAVMHDFLLPKDWETRWPEYAKSMKTYQAEGSNAHDDAQDCTTGIMETIQV